MSKKVQEQSFLNGLKVLYLEDDVHVAQEMLHFLSRRIKSIRHEKNAQDGLRAFKSYKPDIIITDVIMPGMDGIAMCEQLHQQHPETPIIVTTAYDDAELLHRAIEIGVDSFLVKPIRPELLLQKLLAIAKSLHKDQQLRVAHQKIEQEVILRRHDEEQMTVFMATLDALQADLKTQQYALDQHSLVAITDVKGDITYANDKFCDVSKYSREELIGKNHRILKSDYHSEDFFKQMWKTIANGKVWHGEVKNLNKQGDTYWVDTTIVPFLNKQGKPHQYVAIRTDITQKKIDGLALERAKDEALDASKMKSEFLATMSHEIRTPMNGVLGMVELLLDSPLQQFQREYAHTIMDSGTSLLDIINDILDFSKIEAGKLEIHRENFDFCNVVESVAELMAPIARQKDLSLMTHVDTDLPVMVIGDLGRLRQVLVNLVSNAVKFTPQGEVIIDVSLDSKQDKAVVVKFKVTDTGIGLPDSFVKNLFLPFMQADSTTTRNYGGTGLGLTICKRLVELMGGQLGAESVDGKGSTFWFTLPFKVSKKSPDTFDEITGDELSGIRVLVVDDSHTNREIVRHYLESWGIECITANSGFDALNKLYEGTVKGNPIQLMLIDLAMPGMDGFELAEIIRKDEKYADLPLVMLTASDEIGRHDIALNKGFNAYFNKPIRRSHLFEGLCKVMAGEACQSNTILGHDEHIDTTTDTVGNSENSTALPPILLAEDNVVNQKVASKQLQQLGYEVVIANNGEIAVQLVQNNDYLLVLMDCQMPVMDGYDAATEIRKIEQDLAQKPVTIIAMTANNMQGDREKCLAAGMDDFLPKPVLKEALQTMLDKWTEQVPATATATVINKPIQTMVSTVEEAVSDDDFNKAAIEHLRAELGDYVGEVVQSYLGDIPELLEQLRHGILSADIEQSQRLIHSLKSSSVQLGLTSLGGLAAELENRIRTGGKACSNQELDKLQQLFKRGAEHLAMYAKQTNHLPKFEIDEDRAIVVIVDDDASMRMMLRRVMETDGYQVEEASNGEQAVTLCQNVQPEIVLMDCMMPVMNGFDACEKINTMPECENTSVLMITGLNDDVTVQRAMKSGAADFITKPIFLPVLSQRVKHLIEMKQAQAHVKHLAYHDTLTGLPNRMLFNDRLQSAIKLANRHNNRLAVMFLDLDHFKKVNDSLGHSIGDKLLQMVAERIQNTLRESDTLSRMGGDEFTILLPGLAEGDDGIHSLQHLAQKMIDSLTEVFVVDNNDVFIGTSIGVSVFPDDSDDPYALVKHADAAMYYAKANGRNAFSLYCVTMNDEIHEYLQLENGLRRALERDELTVFYQPQ